MFDKTACPMELFKKHIIKSALAGLTLQPVFSHHRDIVCSASCTSLYVPVYQPPPTPKPPSANMNIHPDPGHTRICSVFKLLIERATNISINKVYINPTSLRMTLHFPKQNIKTAQPSLLYASSMSGVAATVSTLFWNPP